MTRWFLFILLSSLQAMGLLKAQETDKHLLISRNTGKGTLWDSNVVRVFGFTQTLGAQVYLPGPTIDLIEGDSVEIDLWNVSQGAPHTIHLHGLDVNQLNDGVPHLSFDVKHMKHGYYRFKAPHAGTYLYHCHVASSIHVQAGMYGMLIIRPKEAPNRAWANGPTFEKEFAFMLSEIDTTWHTEDFLDHEHDTNRAVTPLRLPVYRPQYFLVNGQSETQLDSVEFAISKGGNYYLRFANIGFTGNRIILPASLGARIISSDGRPLPVEERTDTILIFPGERYGVMVSPTKLMLDSIEFQYFNLNAEHILSVQQYPMEINGNLNAVKTKPSQSSPWIYPNPGSVHREVFIRIEGKVNVEATNIKVTNMEGRIVDDIEISQLNSIQSAEFAVRGLKPGLYFVRIGEGLYPAQKLVVF